MQPDLAEDTFFLHRKKIYFPEGLPAFETVQDYILIANEAEAPFIWLQSVTHKSLAFITIDPFLINQDYLPDLAEDDVSLLKIEDEEDVFILSIVNMKNSPDQGITANLVSPIVINWKKQLGKQVILQNHQKYSVRFRIEQQPAESKTS